MKQEVKVEELSLEQLKVLIYDLSKQFAQTKAAIDLVENEIQKRVQEKPQEQINNKDKGVRKTLEVEKVK